MRFTSIRHVLALCALRLGSKRPLRLSALSAFNNTSRQCDLKLVFGYIILVDVVGV